MKLRTTRYIIKEGALNIYRNRLMSLASISIVAAALLIFGIFMITLMNLNTNLDMLKQQSEVLVYCYSELDDSKVSQIENLIKQNNKVAEYTKVSKKEALEKIKDILGESQDVIEGLDDSFLPVLFKVTLKNPEDSAEVAQEFQKIIGVEKVEYSQDLIEAITKIARWVKIISSILILILLIVSVFIISNTIKLTVFARRKEISIMKYIGATDWFIRWPFIVEGVIIGIIGAAITFIVISYGYNAIEVRFNSDFAEGVVNFNLFRLVKMKEMAASVMAVYAVIGTGVGVIGSLTAIRKYLKV